MIDFDDGELVGESSAVRVSVRKDGVILVGLRDQYIYETKGEHVFCDGAVNRDTMPLLYDLLRRAVSKSLEQGSNEDES